MDPTNRIQQEKSIRRAELRARRDLMPPAARRRANRRIGAACFAHPAVAAARSVFVYVSTPAEVATIALIERLEASGRRALVPLIRNRRSMTAVRFPGWAAMRPGALGILSPPLGPPEPEPVDVALVPGLAFTRDGGRLGYGGGYYDRWLAQHPATVRIALAFDLQVVAHLPTGPDDVRVVTIITETDTFECLGDRNGN